MEYYPGMLDARRYEDAMDHNETMIISYKDWDTILLTICVWEEELQSRLRNSDWPEKHRLDFQAELEKLAILKKKVVDKIR